MPLIAKTSYEQGFLIDYVVRRKIQSVPTPLTSRNEKSNGYIYEIVPRSPDFDKYVITVSGMSMVNL